MIKLEHESSRIYIVGDTFAIKDKIKALGGHWDGDRRAWWVGKSKAAEAESLLALLSTGAQASAGQPQAANKVADDARVVGKARYKSRTYYVLWVGECKSGDYKARLTVLDGSIDFWVTCARPHEAHIDGSGDTAAIVKTYAPREYRGRTEYTTLGSLRRFIARQKNTETRCGECYECGAHGPAGETCRECYEGSYA
jgi:hypothetical protein